MVRLGDLMVARAETLNPAAFPDEEFELYSIPAHDRGSPEIARGSVIGSVKQIVQPGDVMISKIIPHIRRARVVSPVSGRRQIASGEWIVFRGDLFDPRYLRHLLVSDGFHAQYMNTVAGVGGSLVRARPQQVKSLPIPLPPVDEQRRIAAILDQADALRAKRGQVLAHLDTLNQSIFQDMFAGRPWESVALDEISLIAGEYGANVPSVTMSRGTPRYVRITDILDSGDLRLEARAPGGSADDWGRYLLQDGDLLFARSGATVGKTYRHFATNGDCVFAGYLIRFRPDPTRADPDYLFGVTKTPEYRAWVAVRQKVVAQPNINARQYGRELRVPLPPLSLQQDYAAQVRRVHGLRVAVHRALVADCVLFGSLQSRAFRGEL